jgi:hypothetical protein
MMRASARRSIQFGLPIDAALLSCELPLASIFLAC